ncbi:MAG: ATP-binding cassette domain-containing protein [Streptosporangiales bacterium]|nr:ATP-binding cassette domain-containing protein [Streptosporangiales bacterium]
MQRTGVVLDRVGVVYTTNDGGSLEAVRDVSGVVADGRFVSLIGPSGCGKSTLLDVVGGLLRPARGGVVINGEQVSGPRRDTAMVFQEDSTLHWRTVVGNVAFGLEIAGVGRREREARARDVIKLVGLAGFEDRHPRELSGGMKQRVAIARALLLDPRIMLMDEPFGALDQQTRMFIGRELLRVWEETRKSVLFVTHDIQEAVYLSDEVWVMSARPSVIKSKIAVDLDRPRAPGTMGSRRFHELTSEVWELLRVESEKALDASGELRTTP